MKSAYDFFRYTIAASDRISVNIQANFLNMLSTTGASNIVLSIGEAQQQELPVGLSVDLTDLGDFKRVDFINTEASPVTIEFSVSAGRVIDNRLILSGSVFTSLLAELQGDTTPETWGTVQVSNAVGGTVVAASNSSRKSIGVQNLPTNTGAMYIGYDATLSSAGNIFSAIILPGQQWARDDYRGAVRVQSAINNERVAIDEV